ncbi:hypothetical protein C8351_05825 [Salmonella enterica]|nr:hypothetical protein [Salmonella enterica]QEC91897.1 hypothetical protein C8351_05825 [Salmonella enterica]
MTMISDRLTDEQLAEILSGVVEGVEPTTQELAMAAELQERRKADSVRPVGYVSESAIFCLGLGQHEVITAKPEKDADDARYWDVIPLYAAPQPVPDDWQLVPKNPTGPMLAAGYQAYMKGQHRGRFYRSYQVMLEAAPKLSEVDHDDDK